MSAHFDDGRDLDIVGRCVAVVCLGMVDEDVSEEEPSWQSRLHPAVSLGNQFELSGEGVGFAPRHLGDRSASRQGATDDTRRRRASGSAHHRRRFGLDAVVLSCRQDALQMTRRWREKNPLRAVRRQNRNRNCDWNNNPV